MTTSSDVPDPIAEPDILFIEKMNAILQAYSVCNSNYYFIWGANAPKETMYVEKR